MPGGPSVFTHGKRPRAVTPDSRSQLLWTPPPGFVEVVDGVWEPRGYVPSPYEIRAPAVKTEAERADEYAKCYASLAYWAVHYVWSLHQDDPSGEPQYRKIPAHGYLVDFFDKVQIPTNTHIEKSRQMMMSIAWCAVFLWDILFHENWANLAVSRRELMVDDGGSNATTNSLFGKVLSLWRSLPAWQRYSLSVTKGLIRCDETISHIAGHTGTSAAGRGSTYNRALMDECAHLEYGTSLFAGLSQAAKNGLAMSDVPNGMSNIFARVRHLPNSGFQLLHYHWSMHPEKGEHLYCQCGNWQVDQTDPTPPYRQWEMHVDVERRLEDPHAQPVVHHRRSPWYDKATAALPPEIVAAEFDISYALSRRGRVWERFDARRQTYDHMERCGPKRSNETDPQYRRRYLESVLEPDKPTVIGWDFGVDDPTSLVFGQVIDEEAMHIRWLDSFEDRQQSWDYYHSFVNGLWLPVALKATGLSPMHYGDPAGKQRASDLTSWIRNLRSREPKIVVVSQPKRGSLLEWLDFVHNIIRRNHFEISSYAAVLTDHVEQYHYPTDDEGNTIPGRQEPVHDEHSHSCSALRYVYQFRWSGRLIGAGTVVDASGILGTGGGEGRGLTEPDSLPSPRDTIEVKQRLKYF